MRSDSALEIVVQLISEETYFLIVSNLDASFVVVVDMNQWHLVALSVTEILLFQDVL